MNKSIFITLPFKLSMLTHEGHPMIYYCTSIYDNLVRYNPKDVWSLIERETECLTSYLCFQLKDKSTPYKDDLRLLNHRDIKIGVRNISFTERVIVIFYDNKYSNSIQERNLFNIILDYAKTFSTVSVQFIYARSTYPRVKIKSRRLPIT